MDYSFGNWIKRRRRALDISQQELADRVGCSVSAIFKIESDERRPSRQIAELLAEHLQIPPEQRLQFLKVARRERMVEILEPVPTVLEPLAQPAAARPESNLPQSLNPLVGREHELHLVLQQISAPACRLLTLTGLGGVGKTRLALEAADRLRGRFAGGVYFVPLAGTRDPRLIIPAIADALGFLFSGEGDPGVQLLNYLREKEILLVLDNFEQLLEGVEVVIDLLQGGPRVKCLVTSREALNLQAEWVCEVQGLPVPAGGMENGVQASSAEQLFVQRARQARLDFEMTEEEQRAVERICQLVEGLPLGIELAAAWVRALTCEQIAKEIERNLDFLRTAARDIPERHRSLRAVLDHSWELLSAGEQEVFKRLSVLRGGFRREAAQEVAGASLDEIASLLNKSMVKRVGEERYDLHELVRQYAAVQLESDPQELERTRARYICYYAGMLDEWQRPLRSPRQLEILREMSVEMDNIRQAWDWMVARGQLADIRRSVHCVWDFFEILGRYQEGADILGQAADVLQAMDGARIGSEYESQVVLGLTLAQYAYFSTHLGWYERANAALQHSLALLHRTTDPVALADMLTFLCYLQFRQGEYQLAIRSARESLDLNRRLDNPAGLVLCLIILSCIHLAQGDFEQVITISGESLSISRRLGDPHGTADSLITLSTAARQVGKYAQARLWSQEALEISRSNNHRLIGGLTLWQLGLIHFELGDAHEAVDLLRQAVSQFKETGDRTLMARALIDLGVVLRASDSPSESEHTLLKAFQIAADLQSFSIACQALGEMAWSEMEQGRMERALELVTFVLVNAETSHEAKQCAGQLKANLEALLPPEKIVAVQAQAQAKALADLVHELSGEIVSDYFFSDQGAITRILVPQKVNMARTIADHPK